MNREMLEQHAPQLALAKIPVGNAGNITAYWRGFVEYYRSEVATKKPCVMGWLFVALMWHVAQVGAAK